MFEEIDVAQIRLTPAEKLFLRKLRFKKHLPLPENMRNLRSLGLVDPDYLDEKGPIGECVPSGTVHLTDKYIRWCFYSRDTVFKEKIPVIISVIALLKSCQDEILWLLRQIAILLK